MALKVANLLFVTVRSTGMVPQTQYRVPSGTSQGGAARLARGTGIGVAGPLVGGTGNVVSVGGATVLDVVGGTVTGAVTAGAVVVDGAEVSLFPHPARAMRTTIVGTTRLLT
ncbi:MAG: hypothetical protein ACKOFF_05890 [Acidimicrobiales bacterium]